MLFVGGYGAFYSLILARILRCAPNTLVTAFFQSPCCHIKETKKHAGSTYSLSRNSWYSSSPALTGEPPNYKHQLVLSKLFGKLVQTRPTEGIRTRSPTVTPMGRRFPSLSRAPGPTARTLASFNFSTLDSGRKMPPAVLVSALMRWTRTRSRRGARARMDRIEVAYV